MKPNRMKYFLIFLTFLFGFISVKPVLASEKPVINNVNISSDGTLDINLSSFTDYVSFSFKVISSGQMRTFSLKKVQSGSVAFYGIKDIWNPDTTPIGGEVEIVIINSDGIRSDPYSGRVNYDPDIDIERTEKILIPGTPFKIYGKRFGQPCYIILLFSSVYSYPCSNLTNTSTILNTNVGDINGGSNSFHLKIGSLFSDDIPITVAKKPEILAMNLRYASRLVVEGKNFGTQSDTVSVKVKVTSTNAEINYPSVPVQPQPSTGRTFVIIDRFYEFYDPETMVHGGEELEVTVTNNSGVMSVPYKSKVIFGPRIDETSTGHNLYPNFTFTIRGKRFGIQRGDGQFGLYSTSRNNSFLCSEFTTCFWTDKFITIQDINKLSDVNALTVNRIIDGGIIIQTDKFSINVLTGTPSPSPSVVVSTSPTSTAKSADFNGDGVVDEKDLTKLKQCYMPFARVSETCRNTDLDNNGYVGAMDYSLLLTQAGR